MGNDISGTKGIVSTNSNAFTMHILSWLAVNGTAAVVEFPGVLYRGGAEQKSLQYGDLVMDLSTHVVALEGRELKLTAKEFLLLRYLLQHRGRVLSRDLLLHDVWGYQYAGGTRTVDVHVRRLREKIPLLVESLVTVKQFGYRLT